MFLFGKFKMKQLGRYQVKSHFETETNKMRSVEHFYFGNLKSNCFGTFVAGHCVGKSRFKWMTNQQKNVIKTRPFDD